jgi:hypothetical protein
MQANEADEHIHSDARSAEKTSEHIRPRRYDDDATEREGRHTASAPAPNGHHADPVAGIKSLASLLAPAELTPPGGAEALKV